MTGPVEVTVVEHPLVVDALSRIRDEATPNSIFRDGIDERLNDQAFIVPGLGDAGDRLFGRFA